MLHRLALSQRGWEVLQSWLVPLRMKTVRYGPKKIPEQASMCSLISIRLNQKVDLNYTYHSFFFFFPGHSVEESEATMSAKRCLRQYSESFQLIIAVKDLRELAPGSKQNDKLLPPSSFVYLVHRGRRPSQASSCSPALVWCEMWQATAFIRTLLLFAPKSRPREDCSCLALSHLWWWMAVMCESARLCALV